MRRDDVQHGMARRAYAHAAITPAPTQGGDLLAKRLRPVFVFPEHVKTVVETRPEHFALDQPGTLEDYWLRLEWLLERHLIPMRYTPLGKAMPNIFRRRANDACFERWRGVAGYPVGATGAANRRAWSPVWWCLGRSARLQIPGPCRLCARRNTVVFSARLPPLDVEVRKDIREKLQDLGISQTQASAGAKVAAVWVWRSTGGCRWAAGGVVAGSTAVLGAVVEPAVPTL